jgi:hypothetical protein
VTLLTGAERSRCSVNLTWTGSDGIVSSSWQALMPIRTCRQGDAQSCPASLVENTTVQPVRCLGPTVTTLDLKTFTENGFPALNTAMNQYVPTNYSAWENPSDFTFQNLGDGSLLM